MKRRGFLGVVGAALFLPLRGIADAICNPSLVHLFHQGRQFILVAVGANAQANTTAQLVAFALPAPAGRGGGGRGGRGRAGGGAPEP